MNTLFLKEWREHFKVAVLGLAILTLFLALSYWDGVVFYRQIAAGAATGSNDAAQPLLSKGTFAIVCIFCSAFGALLGWLQIYSERHRDLWAFLVHRPVTRTEIFFSKMMAGLCLYAAGAGVPLVIFIILVWWPGHVAAPFEWTMALPVFAMFLNGTVFYFAGLLTGLRQARWFASRGLGLVAAILMTIAVINLPVFWISLVVIVISATILAAAACGSFSSHGFYEGQPVWNRRALVTTLMAGCFALVLLATMLILVLPQLSKTIPSEHTTWQMMYDGTIYRETARFDNKTELADLNGLPLKDKKTGRLMTREEVRGTTPPSVSVPLNFNTKPQRARTYFQASDFFSLWQRAPDTLWYWERNGRLWAFDSASRRFNGSLGPNGFKQGISEGPDRFSQPGGLGFYVPYNSAPVARILMTSNVVYKLDLENRACEVFYKSTNDEQILAATGYSYLPDGSWDYTIVVTKSFVRVLAPDGQCVWQTPFEPAYPAYNGVAVSYLGPTNRFAVWISHDPANKKLPTHLVWLAENGTTLITTNVPPNEFTWKQSSNDGKAIAVVAPPAFYFIVLLLADDLQMYRTLPWADVGISFGTALVCVAVGWGLGRRHYFSAGLQAKWAIFHLFFGLPSLLALLCAQEWAARVPCPHCRKPRVVDRERCEHCHAEFAPPAKLGIEIFEAAAEPRL
jgi:ABC-type transport system involved in multi-copper enzyme maturation permease subunit